MPLGCIVLNRDLVILDVTDEYARLTLTDPDLIKGRQMFDVFPDNPGDPQASGVRNLRASLDSVLKTGLRSSMAWQRYDVRDATGIFIERHWSPTNTPILDENGDIALIVHHATDVTVAAKRYGQLPMAHVR